MERISTVFLLLVFCLGGCASAAPQSSVVPYWAGAGIYYIGEDNIADVRPLGAAPEVQKTLMVAYAVAKLEGYWVEIRRRVVSAFSVPCDGKPGICGVVFITEPR